MDIPQRCAAQTDGCRHIAQTAFHQNDIRCIDCHIGSCTDGDTGICSCQCRCIIDSISDHRHFALRLQAADHAFLSIRQYSGDHFIHTCLYTDRTGCLLIVPGKHNHTDSHIAKLRDCLRAVFLHGICHGNHTEQSPVSCKKKWCLSFLRKSFCLLQNIFFYRDLITDIFHTSAEHLASIHRCCQSISRQSLKILRFFICDLLRFYLRHNCACKRMLAFCLKSGCKTQKFLLIHTICRDNIGHFRLPVCDGSRLVQCNNLGSSCIFQSDCVLK